MPYSSRISSIACLISRAAWMAVRKRSVSLIGSSSLLLRIVPRGSECPAQPPIDFHELVVQRFMQFDQLTADRAVVVPIVIRIAPELYMLHSVLIPKGHPAQRKLLVVAYIDKHLAHRLIQLPFGRLRRL